MLKTSPDAKEGLQHVNSNYENSHMDQDAEDQYIVRQWENGYLSREDMMTAVQSRINCIAIGEMLKGI